MILQIESPPPDHDTKPSRVTIEKHIKAWHIPALGTDGIKDRLREHLDLCYTFRRVWNGVALSRELLIHEPSTEEEWFALNASRMLVLDQRVVRIRLLAGDRLGKCGVTKPTDISFDLILSEAIETARVVRSRFKDTYPLFPCTNTPPVVLAAE